MYVNQKFEFDTISLIITNNALLLYVIRFLLYFNGKFNWYTELIIHLVKLRLSKNVKSVSDWMPQKWTITARVLECTNNCGNQLSFVEKQTLSR